MNIEKLTNVANAFLQNEYQLDLNIPIIINKRLRITLGSYVTFWKTDKPKRIELSGTLIKYGHDTVIIDVLKHELVHYALHSLGFPSDDGDEYFENELKRLGIGSTESNYVGELHKCKCEKCNNELHTNVKSEFKSEKYVTSCCKGKILYLETLIFNGTEGKLFI